MKITWDRTGMRFLVHYNEIELWPYISNLVAQDYRLRLGVERYFGTEYPALTVETDTIGAAFHVGRDQILWRPFYKLSHLERHGLDCLPWYQVKGRTWDIICEENSYYFKLSSRVWPRLAMASTLRQLEDS